MMRVARPRRLTSTPFPYTTLFRSAAAMPARQGGRHGGRQEKRTGPGRPSAEQERVAGLPELADDLVTVGRRSEEHTSELQSRRALVCRLLLDKQHVYHDERGAPQG